MAVLSLFLFFKIKKENLMEMITQIKQKVANNKKIMQQIKDLKSLSLERSLNTKEREIIVNDTIPS